MLFIFNAVAVINLTLQKQENTMSDDLHKYVCSFRKAIEDYAHTEKTYNHLLSYFPIGCCECASELLQKFLYNEGIVTFLVRASFENNGQDEYHVWLETEAGIVIDITGDQYRNKSEYLFYSKPIYVGKVDRFHLLFSIKTKEPPIEPSFDYRPKEIIEKMNRDYEGVLRHLSNCT